MLNERLQTKQNKKQLNVIQYNTIDMKYCTVQSTVQYKEYSNTVKLPVDAPITPPPTIIVSKTFLAILLVLAATFIGFLIYLPVQ